jgi:hypothetical protein
MGQLNGKFRLFFPTCQIAITIVPYIASEGEAGITGKRVFHADFVLKIPKSGVLPP